MYDNGFALDGVVFLSSKLANCSLLFWKSRRHLFKQALLCALLMRSRGRYPVDLPTGCREGVANLPPRDCIPTTFKVLLLTDVSKIEEEIHLSRFALSAAPIESRPRLSLRLPFDSSELHRWIAFDKSCSCFAYVGATSNFALFCFDASIRGWFLG